MKGASIAAHFQRGESVQVQWQNEVHITHPMYSPQPVRIERTTVAFEIDEVGRGTFPAKYVVGAYTLRMPDTPRACLVAKSIAGKSKRPGSRNRSLTTRPTTPQSPGYRIKHTTRG